VTGTRPRNPVAQALIATVILVAVVVIIMLLARGNATP